MQSDNNSKPINFNEGSINLREEIEKYLSHWKWFVLCIVITLLAANLHLRYKPVVYEATTSILIDDEEHGGVVSDLSAFKDLGLMGGAQILAQNEIGVLKSRSLMEVVVKDLELNISYFSEGNILTTELFRAQSPIRVNFFSKDSILPELNVGFTIVIKSATEFELLEIVDDEEVISNYVFGENIQARFGDFTVTPTNINNDHTNKEVMVRIAPIRAVAKNYRNRLVVDFMHEGANLINITLVDQHSIKAETILNKLVYHYNKKAVEDKSLIAINTNAFIGERLTVIENDLLNADKGVALFKTSNKLTDISSEASLILTSNAALTERLIDLNTQIKLADYVADYLKNNSDELIPANLGLADGNISSNTVRYNELILERNRIMTSSSNKNPVIINLNSQIAELRGSVSQSLVNLRSSMAISLEALKQQEELLNSKITAVPNQEREFRDVQRQQKIIETLYLYLLQKREENAISLVATLPNAKIIDTADGSSHAIVTKKSTIYLAALLVGLVLPFGILYLLFLLDNKVRTSKEVENIIKAPFLGDIPNTRLEKKLVVSDLDRSNEAEAFRMLRTNIGFMLSNEEHKGGIIYVTSTMPNEGKTFIAVNLASVLSLSNKKVLLIGADLRKPKVAEYLNMALALGLTSYLIDKQLKVTDVIQSVPNVKFDIIQSGIIPPNPSELLMNGRIEELLDYGKEHYDYVIVDTSPVSLVTDTLVLSQKANLILYVVRANFLDKRLLEIPAKLYKEKRFPNMAVVLNDSTMKKVYGYGYYHGEEEKSWWKKRIRN